MYRLHDYPGLLIRQRQEEVVHEARMRRLAKQANSRSHAGKAHADHAWRSVFSLLSKAALAK
jgi:hypothetical protein